MGKVKLTIGDWSSDGHSKHEVFVYNSNKSCEEIQNAYKASCKLTGLQFNNNKDYTGLNLDWQDKEYNDRHICVGYGETQISKLAEKILLEHGIDVWEGFDRKVFKPEDEVYIEDADHFEELLIKFIKLSLPDLKLKEASFKKSKLDEIEPINGWWCKELNHHFGYGLYE